MLEKIVIVIHYYLNVITNKMNNNKDKNGWMKQ